MQEKNIFQPVFYLNTPEQKKRRLSRAFDDVASPCSRVEPQKEREKLTTGPCLAVNLKKKVDLGKVQFEPAIWLRVAGQRIPCFDRCQMTRTLMSNIKDVCARRARKLGMINKTIATYIRKMAEFSKN